jgi:hypothetical protein
MVETCYSHRHQHLAFFGTVSRFLFQLLCITPRGIKLIFLRLENSRGLLAPSNLVSQLGQTRKEAGRMSAPGVPGNSGHYGQFWLKMPAYRRIADAVPRSPYRALPENSGPDGAWKHRRATWRHISWWACEPANAKG